MKKKGKIFLLDDDTLLVSLLDRALAQEGYTVYSRSDTDDVINAILSWAPDVLILDISLPGKDGLAILQELMESGSTIQVVMLTGDDKVSSSVKAMKLGAMDYLTKPFDLDELLIVLEHIFDKERLKAEVGYFRQQYDREFDHAIIGDSAVMREMTAGIRKLATAGVSTVLVTGESGTGKELAAWHLHHLRYGKERPGPFVRVNCAAMPEALLETELFGYDKGAFTDAKGDRKGLFELADNGSLLLDEIGEMKGDLQAKLLRVLEEHTIRRVAGATEIPVDVMVIATTHQDISRMVKEEKFRLDLFYRLDAFRLHLPPLRERRGDVVLLANHFLARYAGQYNKAVCKRFSDGAAAALAAYDWPGNVRELRNVVERLVVLESAETIDVAQLPQQITRPVTIAPFPSGPAFVLPAAGLDLEELQKDMIGQALLRTRGNKAQAAVLLNMTIDAFRYAVKKYGLN